MNPLVKYVMSIRWGRRSERPGMKLGALLRHEGGVSAVEFALLAPMLVFGLLMMVDVGLAVFQRMTMDHILRAGAQRATVDPGVTEVRKVLEVTAAENFTLGVSASSVSKPALTLMVERYCVCPGNHGTKVVCSTICAGSAATLAYYSLSASSTYPGMLLPDISFKPVVQVQVR